LRERLSLHSGSAIFAWIVGDEQAALELATDLQAEGFFVPAIRYPTVAKGAARLRISVTAVHTAEQICSLCDAIKNLKKQRRNQGVRDEAQ
jgi:7-keto-8-aminopelargonate synthetase-like enzyme